MATLKFAALLLAAAYLAIAAYMYLNQRRFLYFPDTDRASPASLGLAGVEEQVLTTGDGERIIAWYAAPQGDRPVILFLQGNGGSIAGRTERFAAYRDRGFGVLFLSYRGYGGSTGSPSESGLVMDALTAYDWLAARSHGPGETVIVGESLGSGVAVQLATRRKVAALALEAPYTSVTALASGLYWYLPVRLLLKDPFDSLSRIAEVGAPVLISHGELDAIVPFAMGRELFAAAKEPKEFSALANQGHEAIGDPGVWAEEMEFFERHLRIRGDKSNGAAL